MQIFLLSSIRKSFFSEIESFSQRFFLALREKSLLDRIVYRGNIYRVSDASTIRSRKWLETEMIRNDSKKKIDEEMEHFQRCEFESDCSLPFRVMLSSLSIYPYFQTVLWIILFATWVPANLVMTSSNENISVKLQFYQLLKIFTFLMHFIFLMNFLASNCSYFLLSNICSENN